VWPILSQYRNIYVYINDRAKEMVQRSVLYPYRRDGKRMRLNQIKVARNSDTQCTQNNVRMSQVRRIGNSSEFQSRVLFNWQ